MEAADLLGLGEHCSVPECRQKDFLPFKCDCCHKVFCLEHRTYETHSCEKADKSSPATLVCPLCARLVKIENGENANVSFDRHTKEGCDPQNYAKVNKKPKCPVPGCREKLTSSTTYNCKHCHTDVCLKHRLATDHACTASKGPQHPNAAPSAFSRLLNIGSAQQRQVPSQFQKTSGGLMSSASELWSRITEAGPSEQPAKKRQTPQHAPQRRVLKQEESRQSGPQQGSVSWTEACPICNARFEDVSALIAHCQAHDSVQGTEICPQCRASFHSVVELVAHVEKNHPSASTCVLT